nr:unnamed protein product [Callosobruchus analis]
MSTVKVKLIYATKCDKPRACVFVNNNIKALKITGLCSRDTAVTERRDNILREEVLDITLANCLAAGKIREWEVLDDHSASDHKYISFHIKSTCVKETYRYPRRTDWEKIRKELANNL